LSQWSRLDNYKSIYRIIAAERRGAPHAGYGGMVGRVAPIAPQTRLLTRVTSAATHRDTLVNINSQFDRQ
jgi:hypothetical protein